VLLAPRTQTMNCTLGPNPDRQCSPGAFYRKLTKPVICGKSFRTGTVRFVPQSEKFAVERAYRLPARAYGSTLEIDHIVSLELGGSNDIAILYPERALAHPGYHVKDVLENKLHALVCAGSSHSPRPAAASRRTGRRSTKRCSGSPRLARSKAAAVTARAGRSQACPSSTRSSPASRTSGRGVMPRCPC
jgi:hypothetical protein